MIEHHVLSVFVGLVLKVRLRTLGVWGVFIYSSSPGLHSEDAALSKCQCTRWFQRGLW